jgi:hypothetical protein
MGNSSFFGSTIEVKKDSIAFTSLYGTSTSTQQSFLSWAPMIKLESTSSSKLRAQPREAPSEK